MLAPKPEPPAFDCWSLYAGTEDGRMVPCVSLRRFVHFARSPGTTSVRWTSTERDRGAATITLIGPPGEGGPMYATHTLTRQEVWDGDPVTEPFTREEKTLLRDTILEKMFPVGKYPTRQLPKELIALLDLRTL